MRTLLLLILLLFAPESQAQVKDSFLVELGYYNKKHWSLSDTSTIRDILIKAGNIGYTEEERSEKLCRVALSISNKLEYHFGKIHANLFISTIKIYQNDYDSSLHYVQGAKSIAKSAHLKMLAVNCLDQEAAILAFQEKYDECAEVCFETIRYAEKINPKLTIRSKSTLGYVFNKLGNFKRSSKYSQQGYDLGEKYKDTAVMLNNLNLLALNLKESKKNTEALDLFKRGLQLSKSSEHLLVRSEILFNISEILFYLDQYDDGIDYLNQSIEISKVNSSYRSTADNFILLARAQKDNNQGRNALISGDSAVHYALLSQNFELIVEAHTLHAEIHFKYGSASSAYKNLRTAIKYSDSLNLGQLRDATVSAESKFEADKRRIKDSLKTVQQELKLENQNRINTQRLQSRDRLIWIFVIAFVLFIVAGYFILKNSRLIKSQNILVNSQKEEIQLQHTEIRDSIDYAQRIQAAMINKRTEWDKIGQHFIFFRPKDVVSGDFYWAHNKENLSIWVVADCTGHGIPGAFMSMLGFGFLNEIVIERNCNDPAEILDLLRTKIVSALGEKGENQARDGMDVSICIWDKTTNELQYSGANNPLWIIRHKSSEAPDHVKRTTTAEDSALQLLEIAADKMPVGYVDGNAKPFTNKTISLFAGDTIIQLTDGYADQFGGPSGKKLKYAPMKRALIEMQSIKFEEQYDALAQRFDTWRGDLDQVDDVCLVAVKVG